MKKKTVSISDEHAEWLENNPDIDFDELVGDALDERKTIQGELYVGDVTIDDLENNILTLRKAIAQVKAREDRV